jgi:hypothetical protein
MGHTTKPHRGIEPMLLLGPSADTTRVRRVAASRVCAVEEWQIQDILPATALQEGF